VGAPGADSRAAGAKREAALQRDAFEARREELLAAHPGKYIAVCAGEAFAGHSVMEAVHMATHAHPGRAAFLYSQDRKTGSLTEEEAKRLAEIGFYTWREPTRLTRAGAARIRRHRAGAARAKREAALQRDAFEARREELLAAHPGKHIAVCAGEAFVADTANEADRMATRAHPGRVSFLYSPECANVSVF